MSQQTKSVSLATVRAMARRERFVYFARCQGFLKIGVARDVYTRIKVLGTASPWPVDLACYMLAAEREERILHQHFWDLHTEMSGSEKRALSRA